MSFDYQECSVEELADHVEASIPALISTMSRYYKERDRQDIVNKIAEARKVVKKRKLLRQLEAMG